MKKNNDERKKELRVLFFLYMPILAIWSIPIWTYAGFWQYFFWLVGLAIFAFFGKLKDEK